MTSVTTKAHGLVAVTEDGIVRTGALPLRTADSAAWHVASFADREGIPLLHLYLTDSCGRIVMEYPTGLADVFSGETFGVEVVGIKPDGGEEIISHAGFSVVPALDTLDRIAQSTDLFAAVYRKAEARASGSGCVLASVTLAACAGIQKRAAL